MESFAIYLYCSVTAASPGVYSWLCETEACGLAKLSDLKNVRFQPVFWTKPITKTVISLLTKSVGNL